MAKIVDPQLIADIVRQLNVQGRLEPFDISEIAVPVFDIGRLSGISIQEVVSPGLNEFIKIGVAGGSNVLPVAPIAFEESEIFDDSQAAPGAGTVLADTGQIVLTGDYVVQAGVGFNDATPRFFELQGRDAADAVTLWNIRIAADVYHELTFKIFVPITLQRIRWVTTGAVTNTAISWIGISRALASIAF